MRHFFEVNHEEMIQRQACLWNVHRPALSRMRFLLGVASLLLSVGTITGWPPSIWAKGGLHATEDPWNPQHLNLLPVDIRKAVLRMCAGSAAAEHSFSRYRDNSSLVILHFEYFTCDGRRAFCNQTGCLHRIFGGRDGHYQLLRSYYTSDRD